MQVEAATAEVGCVVGWKRVQTEAAFTDETRQFYLLKRLKTKYYLQI